MSNPDCDFASKDHQNLVEPFALAQQGIARLRQAKFRRLAECQKILFAPVRKWNHPPQHVELPCLGKKSIRTTDMPFESSTLNPCTHHWQ
jgi:hypothetical protein